MKTLITIFFLLFSILLVSAQNCTIPYEIKIAYGPRGVNEFDCGRGSGIYLFEFYSDNPFALKFVVENYKTGSSSRYGISGAYDDEVGEYTSEVAVTLNNGSLLNLYLEYSDSNYTCKHRFFQLGVSNCSDTDDDDDGFANDVDCNDGNGNDLPFGPEFCDGYDNNCNGIIDDSDPAITNQSTWVLDEDNDGFPLEGSEIKTCFKPGENYFKNTEVSSTPDCDDKNPNLNPLTVWYRDFDGDGFAVLTTTSCESPGDGYTLNVLPITDCDDDNANINPSVSVECADNKDNDCDGSVDEVEDLVVYLADKDNDGYGDENDFILCNPPTGYIAVYASNPNKLYDCNDNNPNINPGKIEIPYNGIDDDCNPDTVDDSSTFSIPDPNFEQALIDLEIDTDGVQNNSVLVEDLQGVMHLDISFPETNENLPNVSQKITDISGIELFTNLVELNIAGNNITDLRNLTQSNENGRNVNTKLNVTNLKLLNCSYNNLNFLNISKMTALNALNCSNNQLQTLNVQNGNNTSFVMFNALNNLNLTCVNVDDSSYASSNWFNIDSQTTFSEDCSLVLNTTTTDFLDNNIKVYPNPVSKSFYLSMHHSITINNVALYDMLGKMYKQDITEKIDVSRFKPGVYLLVVNTSKGKYLKRIIINNN